MKHQLSTVICTLNSQYIHSSLAPWCLLAGIKAYCSDDVCAYIIEGNINEKLQDAAMRIIKKRPQVIGFCCYIWNITATIELINLIKLRLPDTIIIAGGPEVSYNAEAVLRENTHIDYVISGEGELPFALLLNAVINNKNLTDIPGICYRQDGEIIIASPYVSDKEPPSPYTPEYFNSLNGRIAYLETSRGCPYSCAFCLSGRCGGVRYFNLERSENELLMLANSGTQTVKLVDRTFNANCARAKTLFNFIIENYGTKIPKGVCFHFEIAGDILDDETINLLGTAPIGAIQLEIGLQSFNQKTLEAIYRKTDIFRLKDNIRRVIELKNMHIHIDLIAGLPYEDLKSIEESFNTAYELKPHMLQFGFLKLLYGSPMRERPENFPCKCSLMPPYEVVKTPWLSEDELKTLHKTEDVLNRLYNSGRFRRTLDYLLKQKSYTPFELFYQFGIYADEHKTHNISLDNYTALIFDYFSKQQGVSPIALRDIMVCDRLSSNSSGMLPPVLRRKDALLKKISEMLNKDISARRPKGVKRGLALLYSEPCAVYADYTDKNPVTGEYNLKKYYYNTEL